MKPRVVVLVACALVLCAAIWFATSEHRQDRSTPAQAPSAATPAAPAAGAQKEGAAPPATPGTAQNPAPAPPAPPPATPRARPYVAPEAQGERAAALIDLDKINLMLRDYRTLFGENPVGTNAEIMKAIMGGNPKGAKLGPPEGMTISNYGELLDRWGTPIFFHQISSTRTEIWSAGPDKKMGTSDDVILK